MFPHISFAGNWVEFYPNRRPTLWVDVDSISHEGPLTTFDVVAGNGDPIVLASDPSKHSRFAFDCKANMAYVYISRSPGPLRWLGQPIREPEDQRMYKVVCKTP